MKFFIDTANIDEIKRINAMGVLDGVTTNPSLIAKESGKPFEAIIAEICAIVDGPISAEVISLEAPAMIEEGRTLAKIHPNVVVKLPLIPEGLKACKALTAEGIKTNVTLLFSATQALIAAKAGATYVSPFVGRLDDINLDGMELIRRSWPSSRTTTWRPSPRRLHSPPPPRHRGRPGRRPRGHHPPQGLRPDAEAPPHGQRRRAVSGGLEKEPGDDPLEPAGRRPRPHPRRHAGCPGLHCRGPAPAPVTPPTAFSARIIAGTAPSRKANENQYALAFWTSGPGPRCTCW